MDVRTSIGRLLLAVTAFLYVGCGNGDFPTRPSPVSNSSTTTTVSGGNWSGDVVLGNGTMTRFNMTLIARSLGSTTAVRRTAQTPGTVEVSGTFDTASGLKGTAQGLLDGTMQNGVFNGDLTTDAPVCTQHYVGPITDSTVAWVGSGPSAGNCLLPAGIQLQRQQGGPCSYTASLTTSSFSGNGGRGEVVVDTGAACAWTAASVDPWVTLDSGDARLGAGRIGFTVAANTTNTTTGVATRQARILVANQTLTVTQGAPCTFTVSPGSLAIDAAGGSATVSITTASGCQWTAQSSTSFLSVNPATGAGSGTVTVAAQGNPAGSREGTVTVAGRTITVSQTTGCGIVLSPTAVTHGQGAQRQSVAISTAAGCAWSARTDVPWLTPDATTGTGPGGLGYAIAENVGPRRTGTLTLSGNGVLAGSSLVVTQLSGCTYTLGQPSAFDVSQFPIRFTVTASGACPWTVRLSDTWMNVTGETSITGTGTTTVNVQPEQQCDSDAPTRTGTISLFGEDGTLLSQSTVQQNGRCSSSTSRQR